MRYPTKALLPLIYVLAAPLITISIRFLTFHFDVFVLNFYRYLAGGFLLLALCTVSYRSELAATLRNSRLLGAVGLTSVINFAAQFLFLKGLAATSAFMGDLFLLLGMPLSVVMAIVLFQDERDVARSPGFAGAMALVTVSCIGIGLGNLAQGHAYSIGTVYLFLATSCVSAYVLSVKRMVSTTHPWVIALVNAWTGCLLFFIGGLIWGDLGAPLHRPPLVGIGLLASGAYGIFFGIGIAALAIRQVGVILFSFAALIPPVLTGILGYILLGETLSLLQLLFGGAIIAGCLLVTASVRHVPDATGEARFLEPRVDAPTRDGSRESSSQR